MKKFLLIILALVTAKTFSQTAAVGTSSQWLDINNVKARIMNGGDLWRYTGAGGYIVPANAAPQVSSQFVGGLWIGGYDASNQLHVAAATYRQNGNDYFPGPLDANGSTTTQTCANWDVMYKVNRSTIDSFNLHLFTVTPNSIKLWPGKGNPFNTNTVGGTQDLAPFIDTDADGIYNPSNGDYPSIRGDQEIWWVMNDVGNTHTETNGAQLGFEFHCEAYVFTSNVCLNEATFYHYDVINKGNNNYHSCYIGVWDDADLGSYVDDRMACDSTLNLGIIYNADSFDEPTPVGYEFNPPMTAIQLLSSPTNYFGGMGTMTNCMTYVNNFSGNGNPVTANNYYNYLSSVYVDGTHLTYDSTGYGGTSQTNYQFTSFPDNGSGWSSCDSNVIPTDLRMISSSGPFLIPAGGNIHFDFCVLWDSTINTWPCPTFTYIRQKAICAKSYFDSLTASVHENNFSSTLKIYPSIISQGEKIIVEGKNISSLKIFSVTGIELQSKKVFANADSFIETTDLPAGIYFVQVKMMDGRMETAKFVVE